MEKEEDSYVETASGFDCSETLYIMIFLFITVFRFIFLVINLFEFIYLSYHDYIQTAGCNIKIIKIPLGFLNLQEPQTAYCFYFTLIDGITVSQNDNVF